MVLVSSYKEHASKTMQQLPAHSSMTLASLELEGCTAAAVHTPSAKGPWKAPSFNRVPTQKPR